MFLSILSFLMVTSLNVNAAPVQKRELKSESGVEIGLEYKVIRTQSNVTGPATHYHAQPVYFMVRHPHLKSSDKVRVVLINRETFNNYCSNPPQMYMKDPHYILDLEYQASKRAFVAEFSQARILINGQEIPLQPIDRRIQIHVGSRCEIIQTSQEIAVVINGVWQTDPVNKTPNFKLSMMAGN